MDIFFSWRQENWNFVICLISSWFRFSVSVFQTDFTCSAHRTVTVGCAVAIICLDGHKLNLCYSSFL